MKEDLLHYVWKMRKFNHHKLITTEGDSITIESIGEHNQNAGPDFLNARIRIGKILWAGHVEIHLRASEWYQHGHQNDRSYDNVVLHVVLEEDRPVYHPSGQRIPSLELKNRIPPNIIKSYYRFQNQTHLIPCQNQIRKVKTITRDLWLDRLLVERLESKTALLENVLKRNQQHWEDTFYQFLARGFGAKVNMEAFEQLAISLPLRLLQKHKNSLFQLEALLFGQAGC